MTKQDREFMTELIGGMVQAVSQTAKATSNVPADQRGPGTGRTEPVRRANDQNSQRDPHPSNNVDLVKLDDGRLAIAFHPVPDEDYGVTESGNQRIASSGGGQYGTKLVEFATDEETANESEGLRFGLWISRSMPKYQTRTRRYYSNGR
jgi:hypothetical protein